MRGHRPSQGCSVMASLQVLGVRVSSLNGQPYSSTAGYAHCLLFDVVNGKKQEDTKKKL